MAHNGDRALADDEYVLESTLGNALVMPDVTVDHDFVGHNSRFQKLVKFIIDNLVILALFTVENLAKLTTLSVTCCLLLQLCQSQACERVEYD